MPGPCPGCGCTRSDTQALATHAVVAALGDDDADLAIESGLLTSDPCASCSPDCRANLLAAREARLGALAARDRYRARAARLQRRAEERAERRKPAVTPSPAAAKPSLPAAAAAALARAQARAKGGPR